MKLACMSMCFATALLAAAAAASPGQGGVPSAVGTRPKAEEIDSVAKISPEMVDVFTPGEAGYPQYRIPSLVATTKGMLLAFCEGRQTLADHSKNDIVLRRSTDGGKTWGPLKLIRNDGDDSLNNPCALVDPKTGRVLLFYSRFACGFHTDKCVGGYTDPRANRVYLVTSGDDGVTWTEPADMTRTLKRPDVRWGISTPGTGIVLRRGKFAGRLIAPMIQCHESKHVTRRSYVAYSDDGGKTWRIGDEAPVEAPPDDACAAEPTVVELADGSILMNSRNNSPRRRRPCRRAAVSTDGGQTWSETADVPKLIGPSCQASLLRLIDPLGGHRSRILFANPAVKKGRTNGTIRLSYDEGRTWPVAKTLWPGGFAYCCLTALPDGTVCCLFEKDRYRTITLARFTLEWLTNGRDGLKQPEK